MRSISLPISTLHIINVRISRILLIRLSQTKHPHDSRRYRLSVHKALDKEILIKTITQPKRLSAIKIMSYSFSAHYCHNGQHVTKGSLPRPNDEKTDRRPERPHKAGQS